MDTPLSPVSAQEKLSGALGSVVFFLPILMGVRTPYVAKYMKQGFGLNILQLSCSIISVPLFFLQSFIWVVNFVLFLFSLYIAYQAYNGKDYVFSPLYDNADRLIKATYIENLFSSEK